MLKDAQKGKFDIIMAWAIDRIGRSLSDLLDTIQHLEACGVDLYLDQQNIDTTTPMGKLITREIPRLCRGGSKSLTVPAVKPEAPTDETSNAGPQSTLTKFRRWTVVRVHERIDERRKDTTRD
jgi:hypothetical protein